MLRVAPARAKRRAALPPLDPPSGEAVGAQDGPELLPGAEVRRLQRPVGRHHFGLGLRGRGQGQQRGGGQQGQAGPRAGAVRSLPGLATARRALGRAPAPATMTPGSEEQSILRAVMTGKRRWQPAPSLAPTRPAAVVRRRVRPRRPGPGRRLQQGLDAFLTKPTGPACVLASTTPTWD